MTREEREQALEWFKNRPITMSGAKKMYDLAISALEQPEPCEDTISRQAAIEALHMHLMYRMGTESNKKRLDEWINNLPSIQPKRGKWVKISPANIYECSKCGKNVMTNDISEYNFCHGCGADMRGETDDTD